MGKTIQIKIYKSNFYTSMPINQNNTKLLLKINSIDPNVEQLKAEIVTSILPLSEH